MRSDLERTSLPTFAIGQRMVRALKPLVTVAVTAVLAGISVVGVTTPAGAAGNSANAKRCQRGGWQSLVRADQTRFVDFRPQRPGG